MKCYRKNGSDVIMQAGDAQVLAPSMKCYRKNGSDPTPRHNTDLRVFTLNEVLPKER